MIGGAVRVCASRKPNAKCYNNGRTGLSYPVVLALLPKSAMMHGVRSRPRSCNVTKNVLPKDF
jgi:hypothetical protein